MNDVTFNKQLFLRTILIFVLLSTTWTTLAIVTGFAIELIIQLGYLLLVAASIYYGQKLNNRSKLGYLMLLIPIIFIISSYILGPLVSSINDSMVLYAILNSFFVAFVMTKLLNAFAGIEFKQLTIVLTASFLLIAYILIFAVFINVHHFQLITFNTFQLFLLIPLTLGMTLKKKIV